MARKMRVSDVIVEAGIKVPNLPIITDKDFKTSCPTCGEDQLLNKCTVYDQDGETFYKCKNDCQVILVVGNPENVPIPGRGYRLGNYVIRNTSDLVIVVPNAPSVMFPKSPSALD